MIKAKFSYIVITIVVLIFTLSACDEVPKPADNTPDTTTEPAFEIRRPSEEQDRLLSMERITDPHGNVDYMQPATAAKIIETASNPLYEKSLFRVSILGEEVGTEQDEYGFYFTYIQCRVEEIYSVPDNVNLAVGGTNVTLVDTRGIQDGKMWYYKGCLPTLDCYEYYVLAYLDGNQDTYTIGGVAPTIVPVVDSFEQYKETMTHYGFNVSDYSAIGGLESLDSCVDECKYWFENPDNLQVLKARFADDETDRYWKTIAESERTDLVPQTLADQIIPGGSVNEVIELLGNPHSVTPYWCGGALVYHLTEDGSQTVKVTYNYPSYTVDNIRRDYVVHPEISILETMEEETTYEEVVRQLGAPDHIRCDDDPNSPRSFMEYIFPNEEIAEYVLDFTKTPITAKLINIW